MNSRRYMIIDLISIAVLQLRLVLIRVASLAAEVQPHHGASMNRQGCLSSGITKRSSIITCTVPS